MEQSQQQKSWEPGLLLKKSPENHRKRGRIIGAIVMVLLVIGTTSALSSCAQTQTGSRTQLTQRVPKARTTQPVFLAEHLTFQGDISGTLTTGIDPQPLNRSVPILGQENPLGPNGNYSYAVPIWTQCTDFGSASFTGSPYIADIAGNIGTTRYEVVIKINKNDLAYTQPGTPLKTLESSQGEVELYEQGGKNREWEQGVGPAGQGAMIVLHPDRTSGAVDVWLAIADEASEAESTLHLQGDWRCG
ncbi:MAG TPA: hypothetical protein VFV38_16270 [Ktedonobacteraceae bacterium]|nr:hypothetical protein [Ktedonobacteraceae bacterium]